MNLNFTTTAHLSCQRALKLLWLFSVLVMVMGCSDPGQYVDLKANVRVSQPLFEEGQGPVVMIDAAHYNFHTADDRYAPFANLLRQAGFEVKSNQALFSDSTLRQADIWVIANAGPLDFGPTFTNDEIHAMYNYVANGGALLLVADHTPFPAAVHGLAQAFSIHFYDVYADDGCDGIFSFENGGLIRDDLTKGIAQVKTFGGSVFTVEAVPYRPILRMTDKAAMQHMTSSGLSEKKSAENLLQGAVLEPGQGKLAVFGEAAMFSAQRYGRDHTKMGFHARGAEDNKQFILNVMKFLTGPVHS